MLTQLYLQLYLLSIATITTISGVDDTSLAPNKGSIAAVPVVVDGDTLRFVHNGKSVRYRLARINAAEQHTPAGKRLTVILDTILNPSGEPAREVTCTWDHKGKYGRPIVECTALLGSNRVNLSDLMLSFEGVKRWKPRPSR